MGDDVTRDADCFYPRVRWVVWLGGFAMYTYLLVVPPEWLPSWLQAKVHQPIADQITVGKLAHAIAYGTLTVAALGLPIGWRGWWLCVAALSAHAFGTEFVQTFVPGRSGRWFDVGIDHVGIAAGLLLGGLGYWLWRRLPLDLGPKWMAASQQMQRHAGREDGDASPL